ncbi:hypothetical protein ACFYKT_06385 [Cytobacillus sp. FJAT-53684]|uniref:Phage protein n=1 Tax=Cytobacillus mangrovibacter TaxID=3299024 RepID=A0ABW6JY37_9BACI
MTNKKIIKEMHRIFDYLYESKEYAKSLEDGKEVANKVYCIIDETDKDEKELDMQWAWVYKTLKEAEEELREWNEV